MPDSSIVIMSPWLHAAVPAPLDAAPQSRMAARPAVAALLANTATHGLAVAAVVPARCMRSRALPGVLQQRMHERQQRMHEQQQAGTGAHPSRAHLEQRLQGLGGATGVPRQQLVAAGGQKLLEELADGLDDVDFATVQQQLQRRLGRALVDLLRDVCTWPL